MVARTCHDMVPYFAVHTQQQVLPLRRTNDSLTTIIVIIQTLFAISPCKESVDDATGTVRSSCSCDTSHDVREGLPGVSGVRALHVRITNTLSSVEGEIGDLKNILKSLHLLMFNCIIFFRITCILAVYNSSPCIIELLM